MKNLFKNPMNPILIALVCQPLFLLFSLTQVGILVLIGGILFFGSAAILIISFFVLLFKKEWAKAFYTLVFMFAIVITLGLMN